MTALDAVTYHFLKQPYDRVDMPDKCTGQIAYTRLEIMVCGRSLSQVWDFSADRLQMPFWRLYYPLSRSGYITWQGREIALEPGHVYLIAPETPFSCRKNDVVLDKIVMHFLVSDSYCNCSDAIFDFPESPVFSILAEQLIARLPENENSYSMPMSAMALCAAALEKIPDEYLVDEHLIDPRLLDIRRDIRKNLKLEHKNADMAKRLGVSSTIFVRRFNAAFGLTPQQYILEERLRQAAALLLHSDQSIDEIAENTGFCDRYYFTRAFTKFRYISPAKFRKGSVIP